MNKVLQERHLGSIYIIEIKEDMALEEFRKAKATIHCDTVKVNVLWNSKKQCVDKGVCFVFHSSGNVYNIFVSQGFYKIDERHQEGKLCEEKILMVDTVNRQYQYSAMEHNEFGSTISTGSFSNSLEDVNGMSLSAQEAYQGIQELVGHLVCVTGVETMINWAEFCEIIYNDICAKVKLATIF